METPSPETDLTTLKTIKLLGKGAMGTVFLVHHAPLSDHPFALKVVEKHPLKYKPDTACRVYRELDILARISNLKSHQFLPSLISFSDTNEFWAWAIPYCSGGDLNILRQSQMERAFAPSVIKFYAAEIVCALERLHLMGIVYRDLKPENILIQQSGHITLTDFDLSRTLNPKSIKTLIYSDSEHLLQDSQSQAVPNQTPRESRVNALTRYFSRQKKESTGVVSLKRGKSSRVSPVSRRSPTERSNSFVGTEEYVAPEVIRGEGHEFSVDWWALGILLYEMLYGTTPFKGRNRKETFTNIVTKEVEFTGKQTPLMDLMKKLLDKDPTSRLGFERGALEIKEHSFFDGLRWELLTEVLRPPFIPPRHGEEAAEEEDDAGDVREYFRKVDMGRVPSTPVGSPAREVGGPHVLSLSDF